MRDKIKVARESNFELLRIVCMVMIIFLHTLGHGWALKSLDVASSNYFIANFIKSMSIVAVNCYVLIAGFFGANSEFRIKKVVRLYLQVMFYSIFIPIVFFSIGLRQIDIKAIFSMVFPITMQVWWFITVYLILYIISPYINKLLKALNQKEYKNLLIILFFVFILWSSLFKLFVPIDLSGGYGLYNFVYLYIIGAYINLYYSKHKFSKKKSLGVFIVTSGVLCIFNVVISNITKTNWEMYNYNFILVFISSIALFLFFKEIRISSVNINKVASLTLGVYLIHDHTYVREFIYNLFNYGKWFNNRFFVFYTIYIVIVIFTLSLIIEYIRQLLFKLCGKYIDDLEALIEKSIKGFLAFCRRFI